MTVIPQPVYMNSQDLKGVNKAAAEELPLDEDDLKTPTVEELSFPVSPPVTKMAVEDASSSSSSGSIGSSSGYGSQNTIVRSCDNETTTANQEGKNECL